MSCHLCKCNDNFQSYSSSQQQDMTYFSLLLESNAQAKGGGNLPVLIMQYKRVSRYFLAIIIAIPVVDSMGPIFYLQCGMSIACFSKSRIFWLWIQKPAWPRIELKPIWQDIFDIIIFKKDFRYGLFNLPWSKTFLISTISDCYVNRCWFVR